MTPQKAQEEFALASHKLLQEIWGKSPRDYSADKLRRLTEDDFNQLLHRITNELIGGEYDSEYRPARRKYAAGVRRKLTLRRRGKSESPEAPLTAGMLLARKKNSRLLSALYPDRDKPSGWIKPALRKKGESIDLENFSFIDAPNETMQNLVRVAQAEACKWPVKINFEDANCLDVGPFLVLAMMRQDMNPVATGGTIYRNLRKAVEAVDLRHFLRWAPASGLRDITDIDAFKVRKRGAQTREKHSGYSITTKQRVADELVNKVNDWLQWLPKNSPNAALALTLRGQAKLASMIGEILDNAERHAFTDQPDGGSWWIAGFMQRFKVKGQPARFRCHLSMINLGEPISETIEKSTIPYVQEQLATYCGFHNKLFNTPLQQELLRTICALQDRISRLPQDQSKGGFGIMDMIDIVDVLGDTDKNEDKPRVAIISGSSHISIRAPYQRGIRSNEPTIDEDTENPRLLWFNGTNSPESPPDPAFCSILEHRFPGTIVSMRFSLAAAFLQAKAKKAAGVQ